MTNEINSTDYRRLMKIADVDSQGDSMSAQDYRRLHGQTANDLLRNLDATKPARSHPELDWRRQVVKAAQLHNWHCYWTWQSKHSPAGFPDLVLVKPPRLIFAELKSETGKLSSWQESWLLRLSEVPWVEVAVWRPSDIDRVLEVLAP